MKNTSKLWLIGGMIFLILTITACDNGTGSRTRGGTPGQTVDQNLIGTWGGVEFWVENASDRTAVQAAVDTFKGADDGATSLATLSGLGVNFDKVVITGINSGSGSHIIESKVGGVLTGKIAEFDMDLVNFMFDGHLAVL